MNPYNTPISGESFASATDAGIIELATDAETATGTATDRAITPANLQSKTSSTTAKGIVELATDAETVTGTSDAVVTTPGNITAKMAAPGAIGGTTPAAITGTSLSGTSLTVQDGNITNVGDIALDSISSDDATKPFALNAVTIATDGVLIGNKTPIGSWAGDGVSSVGTANITDVGGAAHGLSLAVGDLVHISNCTTASHKGFYRIVTAGATTVVLDRVLAATDTDLTVTFYKDVIYAGATDGTNGQRIMGYSHQNKPLQIGGDVLVAPVPSGLTGEDVYLAGFAGFDASTKSFTLGNYDKWKPDQGTGTGLGLNGRLRAAYGINLSVGATTIITTESNADIKLNPNGTGKVLNYTAQITVGSGTGVTVNSIGNLNRQVYKVTTTYAAYTDSDTTKGIVIATLPAKMRIVGFYADTTTQYTGGATNAATMVVGITAESAAEIIASHNVFAAPILAGDADAEMGTSMTRAAAIQGGYMPSWTGTTAIYATLVIVNDILSNLTAGSTTFYIETEQF